ncbi:MAG: DoxX family membrane protein, partial [Nannocystaceae bacterium]
MISTTKLRVGFRWLLGIAFVLQGINHFITTDVMVRMMPEVLPAPRLLVQLSGVAEIVLGLMVFPARTRRLAGWGLVLLLLAVFPANLQMALHPEDWPLPSAVM